MTEASGPSRHSGGGEREREREMDGRESGHVCMQVIVHQNPKRPLHTMKERAKALCIDWTANRALHVNRQIIPTACSTQSTLPAQTQKVTNLSRRRRLRDTKEWKFSVEPGGGGGGQEIPARMDLPRGRGRGGGGVG